MSLLQLSQDDSNGQTLFLKLAAYHIVAGAVSGIMFLLVLVLIVVIRRRKETSWNKNFCEGLIDSICMQRFTKCHKVLGP